MSEESYGEFYDSEYRLLYDGTNGYAESQFKSQKQKAKKVYRYLESTIPDILQNAKILDVGGGPGGMPAYFQAQGHQVAGCDLDSNAIAYGTNPDVPLQIGTVEELDIDWKPDIVILSHIVEHFLSAVDDLKSIRELLHKNSVVYIELPGIKWLSPFRRYYNSDFLRQLQNAHTYYFTKTTLENIMEKSGFDTIKIDETIQGIFTPSQNVGNPDFETDYPDVLEHLEKLEKWNKWGVTPIPTSPHDVYTHPKILSLLRRSGMYSYAKRAYNQFLE
jgi:2-polyprenyl-3-methyl-5-hydroxy-6-metoxy-1,4-benzoquinol methylase